MMRTGRSATPELRLRKSDHQHQHREWPEMAEEGGLDRIRRASSAGLSAVHVCLSGPPRTARYAHLYDDPMRAVVKRVGATISAVRKPVEPEPEFPRGKRRRAV